jgi:hypothetical protein
MSSERLPQFRDCAESNKAQTRADSWSVAARICALIFFPILLISCDDAPDSAANVTATPSAARSPALPRIKWLEARGDVTPERWLASRAAQIDLDGNNPSVTALRADLNAAAARFGDPPRMIANRAVQLEEMLAAQGIDEHAPDIISLLLSTASAGAPKEGFGALCQHYFNLRQQGVGRDDALRQLKETRLSRPGDPQYRG